MDATETACPRNCGGYLFSIGETAGGIIHKCFVCESQVTQPKPEGADAQYAASRVNPPDADDMQREREQAQVLTYPAPEPAPEPAP